MAWTDAARAAAIEARRRGKSLRGVVSARIEYVRSNNAGKKMRVNTITRSAMAKRLLAARKKYPGNQYAQRNTAINFGGRAGLFAPRKK